MPEPQRPKPKEDPQDEWGTSSLRVGYEDRPAFHEPRKAAPKRKGVPFLRALGGLMIVAGIAWATYVITSTEGAAGLLRPGWPTRPIVLGAAGLLILLLEKLFR